MHKLFNRCILSPKDIGIENYSVKEIANMMKQGDDLRDMSSLLEFANSIYELLESPDDNSKKILTTGSTRTPQTTPVR